MRVQSLCETRDGTPAARPGFGRAPIRLCCVVNSLRYELAGLDHQVLLVRLPPRFADAWVNAVEAEVEAHLPRVSGAGLVMDFSGVELVNSIAVTSLLQLQEVCRLRGAAILLAALPEPIARFFVQLKLDRRFLIVPGVEEAITRIVLGNRR
ncbi:hypothetical protein BH11PLA1_BH11PLA1_21630 [soil metagenome]